MTSPSGATASVRTAAASAWRSLVPASRPGRALGLMAVVDATGTGLFLAGSVLFFTRSVGLSGAQVGFGLALAGVVSLFTTVPIGALADRFGPRPVLVVLCLWREVGFAAYALVGDLRGYLIVVALLGVADKAASPVLQMLVSQAVGEGERLATMASLRALRNVGFTLGAAAAAIAIAIDTRPAYLALLFGDAASFGLVAVVVAMLPLRAASSAPAGARRRGAWRVLADGPYVVVALLNACLTVHMTLLAVALPLWVAEHTRAPRASISALVVVNTVLAVAFQVRAARGADGVEGGARAQWRAGVALAASCACLAAAGGLPGGLAVAVLIAAAVALTAGELFQSAGGWGLSYALADPSRQGAYLALFSLGLAVQQIIGPPLLTALVIPAGGIGWVALGAVSLACGAASVGTARWCSRHRDKRAYLAVATP